MKTIASKKKESSTVGVRKIGKEFFISASPIFDQNGDVHRVVVVVRDLTELNNLKKQLEKSEIEKSYTFETLKRTLDNNHFAGVVVVNQRMKEVFEFADLVSQFDSTALITGESGVGKEVIAKFIHEKSLRKNKTFIKVNCSSIPYHLLESELFGYEKGAFTGANKEGKKGLLEVADGDSFLLDEVSEFPLELQVKLLRVLQEHEFFRVGGNTPVKVNIRFMAASNKDLYSLAEEGKFRLDLFYRLNVIQIAVPPLRERREEIPALIMLFLNKFNHKYKRNKQITKQALDVLCNQDWLGNIRELDNAIERLAITCHDDLITHHHLFSEDKTNSKIATMQNTNSGYLKDILNNLEKEMILNAYEKTGCTKKAGLLLGINQSTVVKKMQKHGLKYHDLRKSKQSPSFQELA